MDYKDHFRKDVYLYLMIVVFFLSIPLTLRATEQDDAYLIGAGDVLEISVWKDPDLTKQVSERGVFGGGNAFDGGYIRTNVQLQGSSSP